jgi:hypothetical protein
MRSAYELRGLPRTSCRYHTPVIPHSQRIRCRMRSAYELRGLPQTSCRYHTPHTQRIRCRMRSAAYAAHTLPHRGTEDLSELAAICSTQVQIKAQRTFANSLPLLLSFSKLDIPLSRNPSHLSPLSSLHNPKIQGILTTYLNNSDSSLTCTQNLAPLHPFNSPSLKLILFLLLFFVYQRPAYTHTRIHAYAGRCPWLKKLDGFPLTEVDIFPPLQNVSSYASEDMLMYSVRVCVPCYMTVCCNAHKSRGVLAHDCLHMRTHFCLERESHDSGMSTQIWTHGRHKSL